MKKPASSINSQAERIPPKNPIEVLLAQKETVEKAQEFISSLHHLGDVARQGSVAAVRLLHKIAVVSTQHLNNLPVAQTGHLARELSAWPQMRFIYPEVNRYQDSLLKDLRLGSEVRTLYNKEKSLSVDHPFHTLAASLHELVEITLQTAVELRAAGQATIHEDVSELASNTDSKRILGELVQGIQDCFYIVGLAIPPEDRQLTKLSPKLTLRWIKFMDHTIPIAKERQLRAHWRFSWQAVLRATNGKPEMSSLGSKLKNWSKHKYGGAHTQNRIHSTIRQRLKEEFFELSKLAPKKTPQKRKKTKPLRINRTRTTKKGET